MRPGAGALLHRGTGFLASIFIVLTGADISRADPSGLWREKDGGTVRVHSCGPGYCATIASVSPPLDPATGKPWTDKHNADERKRNRPLVGVPVLMSMKPNGPTRWSGQLYDSDRGQTFSGHLIEIDANTIKIEGCALGICAGETLRRVAR